MIVEKNRKRGDKMEGYSVIKIKESTKKLLDEEKRKSGKLLWFIVDEAIKEYVFKEKEK